LVASRQPARKNRPRAGLVLCSVGNAAVGSFRSELLGELAKAGYVEGRNLILEVRSAEEELSRLPGLAAELIDL
jgi:hypothetical protein